MEYYYTSPENISSDSLVITGDEAKHLTKVLRKKTGEEIYVTDGIGNLYICSIEKIAKESIACSIVSKSAGENEPLLNVSLYQSLLKNPDRFEFAIEKSVELGVKMIQPIVTEHVINKKRDKHERWQQISLSAMKQSQRVVLPVVHSPVSFEDAVKNCKSDVKLIAHEKENEFGLRISDFGIDKTKKTAVFIGPEGGFTDEEINLAVSNGFEILNLGKRKFRSETAAIAALSLILLR